VAPKQKPNARRAPDGAAGWDEYAPFYDWENAQTVGRRDVAFWQQIASKVDGRVMELGCGTGRVTVPLGCAGVSIVGVDRSAPMLERANQRLLRTRWRKETGGKRSSLSPSFVRADIRSLPFQDGFFGAVIAPYGILQSLTRDRDFTVTLRAVARVLRAGGTFGIDLVPDVPNWREYSDRVQLRGRAAGGVHLTLVESVRQDRRRRLTFFDQRYVVRRQGRTNEHRFVLTFRTLSVRQVVRRLRAAGLAIEAILGDYRGGPWDDRADVWIILAKKM